MPYSKVGMVKNATKEAMLNLEVDNNQATIKVYATAVYSNAKIVLYNNITVLFETVVHLSPAHVFEQVLLLKPGETEAIKLVVEDETGNILVSYKPEENNRKKIPEAAKAAKAPKDIATNELLYLNGLHIEQYRHATFSATDYYEEAIRRDENDIRNNNALGLWYLRRGQFAKAEPYFNKAIDTLVVRNPNPYDGEPYYNLGCALKMLNRQDEAYDAFYKSTWNDACKHAAFFSLAKIASTQGKYKDALKFTEQSLVKNWHSHSVRHLQTAMLRKNNEPDKARKLAEESIAIDPFNYGCRFEQYLLLQEKNNANEAGFILNELKHLMHDCVHNYIEYALDYSQAGLYEEAIEFLKVFVMDKEEVYPMVYYYLGFFSAKLLQRNEAQLYFQKAASMKPDYCFPHRIEDVTVLETAMKMNPEDAKAPYYLGNFWYDKRQYKEAIINFEKSIELDSNFPTGYRNLSLAYHNKLGRIDDAVSCLEKAFNLDTRDARILMELDQLYKKMNKPVAQRLAFLEKYQTLVNDRDDLFLERITLLNSLGEYEAAKGLLGSRHFHPWEGGEGKVVAQYLVAYVELAKKSLMKKDYHQALELLNYTEQYPFNLGEGKLYGTQENDIYYLQARAYEGMGLKEEAKTSFEKATIGISEPAQAMFYNDAQPDKIFYQGLAWLKLDIPAKATKIFDRLIQFGNEYLNNTIHIDYFAVSLPDLLVFDQDLDLKNKLHCLYLMGLGNLGLQNYDQAEQYFNLVLSEDVNHSGARVHVNMINFLVQSESSYSTNAI
jgi:tetratricopeptide (TPR) repeat protein